MPTLFDPLKIGDLEVPNRVFLAPLTRNRSTSEGRVPNDLMVEYYVQRAGAGLILTEATSVTPQGVGYADTPGLWSQEQVKGWRKVTSAVHEAGGRIFAQLWHVGRISDPVFLNGELPVAPSAIAAGGHVSHVRPKRGYVVPRALETDEIPGIVEAYRRGAQLAQEAGFDGVEVHGANGYLLDQFLQDSTNKRTDRYGGSIENRARLMLEVTDAVVSVWGAGRVGMHLAPRGDSHDMGDSDPAATFDYVARANSGKRKPFAFICAARDRPRRRQAQASAQGIVRRRVHRQRRLHARIGRGGASRRRGRCGRVRQALHRQSRPGAAFRPEGAAERAGTPTRSTAHEPVRLHRLSGARGTGGG